MPTKAAIDDFLSHKKLAVLRWSSTVQVMGGRLDEELPPKGYEISLAYLQPDDPGQRLSDLNGKVEGVIVATPKKECLRAAEEVLAAKIPRVWIQNGCQSPEGVALLEQNGVPTVSDACIMMYAEPVTSVHAFHRWLAKIFGKLAV